MWQFGTSVFNKVVWWRRLGEVENVYVADSFSHFVMYLPKPLKLMEIWGTSDKYKMHSFFRDTVCVLGYWHQRADERHGNPPSRWPAAINGQRQSWKTPGELGVSTSMECDIFPSVLSHYWLGDRKDIRPVKNWVLVCWWWFDWSFAHLIAPVVTTQHLHHP